MNHATNKRFKRGRYTAMKNKLSILAIILFLPSFVYAQSDCVIRYKYFGSINEVVANDTSKIILKVPSTSNLIGDPEKLSKYRSIEIRADGGNFEHTFRSHLSSVFCASQEDIIEDVFKGSNKRYKIILKTGNIQRQISLSVNQISFEAVSDSSIFGSFIQISLGDLKW